MAARYSEAEGSIFGTVKTTSKIDGEGLEKYRKRYGEDRIKLKKGYSGIKAKANELRQKFSNAVTLGA